MASSDSHQLVEAHGWWAGFRNLLAKENADWWGTKTGLVQSLLWFSVINGSLFVVLFFSLDMPVDARLSNAVGVFSVLVGLFGPIGAIIKVQDAIVGERQLGTLEWVLSKPVSRSAVIWSKVLGNTIGVLVTMVVVPGTVAYLQAYAFSGVFVSPGKFALGSVLLALSPLFYLTLTILCGVLFSTRGLVVGVPLSLALGQHAAVSLVPGLARVTPWLLFRQVEPMVLGGHPEGIKVMVLSTLVWIALFMAAAVWRFSTEEV